MVIVSKVKTMYLPFFPLKLVAFPGEELNLHIFEPRYRELIQDVEDMGSSFGICVYRDNLTGIGTEVLLEQVSNRYEDGRLDIKTRGGRVFEIKSFDNPAPGKLYAAGEVFFKDIDYEFSSKTHLEYVFYLKEMLFLLNYRVNFDPQEINSYSFAHKVGLSLDEELELLKMPKEEDRLNFLIHHFKRMIPAIKAAESAKEKIKLNGHFKHLDPLDF